MRPWWKRAIGGALLLGGVAMFYAVASNASVIISSTPHVVEAAEAHPAPVAIVLGAGVYGGKPGSVLTDRLALALNLYESGKVTHILVSGDNDGAGEDEVNPMREWLVARGVPSAAIYLDHAGFRTLDTMRRARQVFGIERAIVCTQQFHLHRSVYLARAAGIDATGVAAAERRWRTTHSARIREVAARSWAMLDVTIGRQPRYLGQQIAIGHDPARITHDQNTVR